MSDTKIFARMGAKGRQFLVYRMKLDAAEPLAMVLPVPVAPGAKETDLRFINLEKYPEFFRDLNAGFPLPAPSRARQSNKSVPLDAAVPLKVEQVGSFEASFVPTANDFSRLDERFRLPPKSFDKLKGYSKYGFAVFKLKPGNQKIHPMAFEFPAASPTRLFFPTVHIHDGEVHEKAEFDHDLYCQPSDEQRLKLHGWMESQGAAGQFVKIDKAQSVVLREEHCYKRVLRGTLANTDTFVEQQT